MNPIIKSLLDIYCKRIARTENITNEIIILQKMKNNHLDCYFDVIRRICTLSNTDNYCKEYDDLIEEAGNHEYVIMEVLRELIILLSKEKEDE